MNVHEIIKVLGILKMSIYFVNSKLVKEHQADDCLLV